jgi:4-hydroxy-3-methylbut-2-enyl diphosphate reductase
MKQQQTCTKQPLTLLLANPRGFCAGVDRAILMVERALEKYGAPVYVRHQIVHNKHVVSALEKKGALFVKELEEIPNGTTQPVLFSAHGVSKEVTARAKELGFFVLDATCPLVTKVHNQIDFYHRKEKEIIMIGHQNHPEVIGTMGQLSKGAVQLVENVTDVQNLKVKDQNNLCFVTQTTLSIDETADIIEALRNRFPTIEAPKKEDICYATTNRQTAVKQIAQRADFFLIVGGKNSSNSNRLVDAALLAGAKKAVLIDDLSMLDWNWFNHSSVVGLSSGASAPEYLVQDILQAFYERFDTTVEMITSTVEDVVFNIPRVLAVNS